MESLRRKLTLREELVRRLANQAGELLKKSYAQQPLALVHSNAEYYDPAWCRNNHIPFFDMPFNNALRMVTGCLRPTPANSLPVLAEKKINRSPTKTSLDVFY